MSLTDCLASRPIPSFAAVRFTLDDVEKASDQWGANCGPAAIAAILGMTMDEVRPHLCGFEAKRYTNPTLMLEILDGLGITWRRVERIEDRGLVRIQWEGPWTEPGVPMKARYRQTHWIAKRVDELGQIWVFDVNAMVVGGWIPFAEWRDSLVPWLIREAVPKGNGKWHATHCLEIER